MVAGVSAGKNNLYRQADGPFSQRATVLAA
jgi:hypothetical protein